MYRANLNVNLMVENATQIKSGITINVGVTAKIQKNIMHVKKIIFQIMLHLVMKMADIQKVLLTIQ